jgi:hypothetical protein
VEQPMSSSIARSQSISRSQAGVPEARNEGHSSGVSWPAIVAGAFVMAALSLALLALGTGVGFSAVSPWTNAGASAAAMGWTAVLWLVLMQAIASSVGGYLTGRLRTKWVNVHTHEVYFRDTAHGFLAWAVGLVVTAAFLTSTATSIMGGVARASAFAADASGPVPSRAGLGADGYLVDTMFRTNAARSGGENASVRDETAVILSNGLREGALPTADRTYLAQIVAARTGLDQADAEKRVDDAYAQARQMSDKARKAVAHSMYWTFLALLIGAFCASLAATVGGKERDRVMAV